MKGNVNFAGQPIGVDVEQTMADDAARHAASRKRLPPMSDFYCFICEAAFRGDECPGCGFPTPDEDEPMTATEEWARGEAAQDWGGS